MVRRIPGARFFPIVAESHLTRGATHLLLAPQELTFGEREQLFGRVGNQLVLQVAVLCRRGRLIKDGLKALGVQLSLDRRTVTSETGAEAVLTPVEFELLRGIVMGAGEVVPRDRLVRMTWQGRRRIAHATFDSHIRGVRAKLRAAGIPLRIRTCRGSGYAWVLPA